MVGRCHQCPSNATKEIQEYSLANGQVMGKLQGRELGLQSRPPAQATWTAASAVQDWLSPSPDAPFHQLFRRDFRHRGH